MTVRTRQSYMDLCRSDRPWKGRDMADLVDKIYDVEEKADRASKVNATKLVQAKADGFDVAGEGFLQKRGGKWILSEPDFLTEEEANKIYAKIRHSHNEYALRRHAPTHHYGGSDPLEGQEIHGLRVVDRPTWAAVRLDPAAPTPPTRRTGDIFWDPDNHCPSFVLEGSDTIWQGPMEDLLYGQNDSGVPHLNGMVGYIKGSQGQRPTIDISRADDRVKSLAVVFATEASIAASNSGYYTSRGFVRDVVTNGMAEGSRLWLQPAGGYGTSKPAPGLNTRNVSLGHVVRSHATTGSVFADITAYPFLDEISGVSISSPTSGQLIRFDGTKWINSSVQSSDMPNHATRHHWDGGDPITGQLISGLRSSDSPSFAGINIGELGAITGRMASNDFWRMKGLSSGVDSGYLEIATADNGDEPIIVRQYNGPDFDFINRELTLLGSTGETTLPIKLNSPSIRVTNLSTGFVRSDSVGNLSSSSLAASELPNHASRHHWDGADPITGQLISGLRSSDSPSFAGINIGELGAITGRMASNDFWRMKGLSSGVDSGYLEIATADNGDEPIIVRQYNGPDFDFINRELTLLGSTGETTLPIKLNSPSIRVTNLSTGFVRSDSVGNLSSSSLAASELPNHASRHHWDGADPMAGQSISGLRTTSSPTFQDLNLTGEVRLGGLIGIGKNGYGGIFLRPNSGIVRFASEESETYCTNAFSAASARFTNLSTGFVRSNGSGQLSSSPLIESDLPSHASRHHYNGADPISGQSISGLRTSDNPVFFGVSLGLGGLTLQTNASVDGNSGSVIFRPSSGIVRLSISDTEVSASTAFSANSGRFTNLGAGFVKSNSFGNLSYSSIAESDLPNHASRHHYNGADSLSGQLISGLLTTSSPRFLNLNLDGSLNLIGYNVLTYDGDAFYVETTTGWQLIKSSLLYGTEISVGLYPTANALQLGKSGYRWDLRANDVDNDLETLTATQGSLGSNIYQIPSEGNFFRLVAASGSGYRNYRLPNPSSGVGKTIVLFSSSSDPDGQFATIYAATGGTGIIYNGLAQISGTGHLQFGAITLCYTFHSDGSSWHVG